MALAAIYRDFCELAFDEVHEPEYTYWAHGLSLSIFRVAQCVGIEFRRDEDVGDKGLLESALSELMESARSEIHTVLLAEFGGESLLFVSLWNTVDYSREEKDVETLESESDDAGREVGKDAGHRKNQTQSISRIEWRENARNVLDDNITGPKLLRSVGFRKA